MPSNKKGGFAALYDVAEMKKAEQAKEKEESTAIQTPTTPTTPTTSSTTSTSTTPTTPIVTESKPIIAPQRDFMKVANSIVRKAIPAGVFTGKSKQVYDYLYSVTRGAIVPTRTIRMPMDDLMLACGIGSDRTLRKNLRRLASFGLVSIEEIGGSQGGNVFTVFLPEEVQTTPTTPTTATTPSTTHHHQHNLPVVQVVESESGGGGLSIDSQRASEISKTPFKTNTERSDDDDAALAALNKAAREITGRELTETEKARWSEVADVLAAEVKIAATRTTVSNVPAFLAEHLRRRLWKIDKRQARAEGRELPDETASQPAEVNTILCPDCGGSNWWYPEGESKGVAKCKHARLNSEGDMGSPG